MLLLNQGRENHWFLHYTNFLGKTSKRHTEQIKLLLQSKSCSYCSLHEWPNSQIRLWNNVVCLFHSCLQHLEYSVMELHIAFTPFHPSDLSTPNQERNQFNTSAIRKSVFPNTALASSSLILHGEVYQRANFSGLNVTLQIQFIYHVCTIYSPLPENHIFIISGCIRYTIGVYIYRWYCHP